jgi:hypothetical protein
VDQLRRGVTPPTKWGSVTNGACALGVGGNDTCTTPTLGSTTVNLFGLNFGGDVDSNDTTSGSLVIERRVGQARFADRSRLLITAARTTALLCSSSFAE